MWWNTGIRWIAGTWGREWECSARLASALPCVLLPPCSSRNAHGVTLSPQGMPRCTTVLTELLLPLCPRAACGCTGTLHLHHLSLSLSFSSADVQSDPGLLCRCRRHVGVTLIVCLISIFLNKLSGVEWKLTRWGHVTWRWATVTLKARGSRNTRVRNSIGNLCDVYAMMVGILQSITDVL